MVITVDPDLETALNDLARKHGVAPELLALQALRERFLAPALRIQQPRDEWERRLRSAATDCGVSLSDEDVSSEGLYE
jgi:predicted transcriptional regulator